MAGELREPLLRAGFSRFEGSFASGITANNKLTLGYDDLDRYRPLRCRVTQALTRLVRELPLKPDMIVPVPSGADGYGLAVANALGIASIRLDKDRATKQIAYRAQTQRALEASSRVVIVEDVPNRLTSIERVLALPAMRERVVGVVGVFDRGDPVHRVPLPVPLVSLVNEHIPAMLPEDSEYWSYAESP